LRKGRPRRNRPYVACLDISVPLGRVAPVQQEEDRNQEQRPGNEHDPTPVSASASRRPACVEQAQQAEYDGPHPLPPPRYSQDDKHECCGDQVQQQRESRLPEAVTLSEDMQRENAHEGCKQQTEDSGSPEKQSSCEFLHVRQWQFCVQTEIRVVRSGRRPMRASARRSQGPPSSFEGISALSLCNLIQQRSAASRENLYSVPYGCGSTRTRSGASPRLGEASGASGRWLQVRRCQSPTSQRPPRTKRSFRALTTLPTSRRPLSSGRLVHR